jgi:hypothetical protein
MEARQCRHCGYQPVKPQQQNCPRCGQHPQPIAIRENASVPAGTKVLVLGSLLAGGLALAAFFQGIW